MEKRKLKPTNRRKMLTAMILLSLVLVTLISVTDFLKSKLSPFVAFRSDSNPDMLAYISDEDQLIVYNPYDRTRTVLLEGVRDFTFGQSGKIIFMRLDDSDFYSLDLSTSDDMPINISQLLDINVDAIGWSPDGHYLTATTSPDDDKGRMLYLWDGNFTINIMPDDMIDRVEEIHITWSDDGRLAFTLQYRKSDGTLTSEIFLRADDVTTNLSQHSEGSDREPRWSNDGKLMFQSDRAGESAYFVWDGVSLRNGMPDTDSFIQVAPEYNFIEPTWTHEGYIGFQIRDDQSKPTRRFALWDVETQKIVRQIRIQSGYSWSWLSQDGRVIFSSTLASGLPSIYLDVQNAEGQILFNTHTGLSSWSSDGYLAYCDFTRARGWFLNIWDGEQSWEVTETSYKPIKWQKNDSTVLGYELHPWGGIGDTFSCNSG